MYFLLVLIYCKSWCLECFCVVWIVFDNGLKVSSVSKFVCYWMGYSFAEMYCVFYFRNRLSVYRFLQIEIIERKYKENIWINCEKRYIYWINCEKSNWNRIYVVGSRAQTLARRSAIVSFFSRNFLLVISINKIATSIFNFEFSETKQ